MSQPNALPCMSLHFATSICVCVRVCYPPLPTTYTSLTTCTILRTLFSLSLLFHFFSFVKPSSDFNCIRTAATHQYTLSHWSKALKRQKPSSTYSLDSIQLEVDWQAYCKQFGRPQGIFGNKHIFCHCAQLTEQISK
jgi:hypothetical protein